MAFISFGKIDKKLLILVAIIISNLISLIVKDQIPVDYFNDTLWSFEEEIGPIISGIIINITLKHRKKTIKKEKKSFKYILILFLLKLVKSCYELIYPYFIEEKEYRYSKIYNTTNGIIIILMTLGTFLLLKYKYYIHHMISMIIFFALGITTDFILGNYFIIKYNYVFAVKITLTSSNFFKLLEKGLGMNKWNLNI